MKKSYLGDELVFRKRNPTDAPEIFREVPQTYSKSWFYIYNRNNLGFFNMIALYLAVALSVLLIGVSADTCSSVEAVGYINVTRPLSLGYIDEQSKYVSHSWILCGNSKDTVIPSLWKIGQLLRL